ncbi:hypothetical protein FNYG_01300 [Fusarium nygamai]|uniref:Uncharacterized protein n=1 Tax=Gibberella nygamai TaxID=42673 RepID=A0A2K0WT57_GIBNY|nr:hypothetical protein FNYG_01300 [Fusarium nygamai]
MQTFIHRLLGWADEVESCDESGHESYYWPLNSSADDCETSNDSFYTASEADSEASTATIGRSAILEPMTSGVLIDTPQQEIVEDGSETVNPHPYLTISTDIAREAIYIYDMMREGVIDDGWNSQSCLLTRSRSLIQDGADFSWRLGWRCDVNYDPQGVEPGDIVVLFTPDRDFVKQIEQGEVVFSQGADLKPVSLLMQTVDPDFSGPEKRLAGRVLGWKVCGSEDSVWVDRQGHAIDRGDPEVIPNIIHLLK